MPPTNLSAPPTPSRIPLPTVQSSPKKYSKPLAGGGADVRMDTARPGLYSSTSGGDVHMATAKGWGDVEDVRMQTAHPSSSSASASAAAARPPPLKLWEREMLETPEVKRKATVAQLCECWLALNMMCHTNVERSCRRRSLDRLTWYDGQTSSTTTSRHSDTSRRAKTAVHDSTPIPKRATCVLFDLIHHFRSVT